MFNSNTTTLVWSSQVAWKARDLYALEMEIHGKLGNYRGLMGKYGKII
jgi:hypothetical protein